MAQSSVVPAPPTTTTTTTTRRRQWIRPPALKKGDTIALISPSFRWNEGLAKALSRSHAHLQNLGFRTLDIYTPALEFDALSHRERVQRRAQEVHDAFRNPDVKGVICTLGGSTSAELLRFLDYDLIRANPKVFGGFSDITVLHGAIHAQAGLETYYGPGGIGELGMVSNATGDPDEDVLAWNTREWLKVVSPPQDGRSIGQVSVSRKWTDEPTAFFADPDSEQPFTKFYQNPGWKWLRPGQARGRIVGGCLLPFMSLVAAGMEYMPDLDGAVLLLENSYRDNDFDNGPSIWVIRSQLVDLANAGVFDKIVGLVVGRPVGANRTSKEGRKEYAEVFADVTSEWKWPILMDVDVGHSNPMVTIPLGREVVLDSSTNQFEIL